MKVNLKYGSEKYSVDVRDTTEILNIKEPGFSITRESFTVEFKSLLSKTDRDFSDVCLILSDKTRLCDYPQYLPWLLDTLEEEGVKRENLKLYIAYGTHPKQSDDESYKSYGKSFEKYTFIHHDCNDLSLFNSLGKTQRNTPVLVRKDILRASLIITFGAISHHYFAGFGGGRKLIFPGLGEKKAIYHNHSLFLNMTEKKLEPGCQAGMLSGNPLAEDLKEFDDYLPEKLSIHGILNSEGKVCHFYFGSDYSDFHEACKVYDSYYKSGSSKEFDLVIASSGGYPKDINFIQAHKSVHNAAAFVKDGGTLVILAECRDGIGTNTFLPIFKEGGWNEMFDKLAGKYEGNGGTALAMKAKTSRIKIYMITSLDKETCTLMGAEKLAIGDIAPIIKNETGTLAVIQNASMLVK